MVGKLHIVNYRSTTGIDKHLLDTTNDIRLNDLWIVVYNHRLERADNSASVPLSGPADPELASLRHRLSLFTRTDATTVISELLASISSPAVPDNRKEEDLDSLHSYYLERILGREGTDGAANRIYLQGITRLVESAKYSPSMGVKLVAMVPIDYSQELKPGAPNTRLIQILTGLVRNCKDEEITSAAAYHLYHSMSSGLLRAGAPEYYYCPEVMSAIYARKAQDDAFGKHSPAAKATMNMELRHRRTPEEIQKYTGNTVPVIIRHLPAITDQAK